MSRFSIMAAATAALALTLAPVASRAQDAAKVAPEKYKVLLDNEYVRILEFKAKTGEKAAMHSHPGHAAYFVTGGKAKFTTSDGKTQEAEGKAGQAIWLPATTHSVESATDTHVVVIEVKSAK